MGVPVALTCSGRPSHKKLEHHKAETLNPKLQSVKVVTGAWASLPTWGDLEKS